MKLSNFFMFDFMITPWIIRVLYFISQIVITIVALISAFGGSGVVGHFNDPIGQFFLSLLFFIGASLGARLIFELLILQFQICENTSQLRRLLENKNPNTTIHYKNDVESGSMKQILFCGHCGEKQENSTAGDICTNCGKNL